MLVFFPTAKIPVSAVVFLGFMCGPAENTSWAQTTQSLLTPAERQLSVPIQRALIRARVKRKASYRIINGRNAKDGQFPWQVALIKNGLPPDIGHFCGGALVHPEWIITAAHCIDGATTKTDLNVLSGSVNLTKAGKVIGVAKLIKHPDYIPSNKSKWRRPKNDVALIKLKNASDSASVRLIKSNEAGTLIKTGRDVIVSGWGLTENHISSEILKYIVINVISLPECNSKLGHRGAVTIGMICAGIKPGDGQIKDTCFGDSGGPEVAYSPTNEPVLIGIVSWGDNCGLPHKYGVYTNLHRYLSWLGKHLPKRSLQ